MSSIPVPDFMADLPVFRGLPVPFTVFVGEDGIPDFKVADQRKRMRCMIEGLCALCGKSLRPKEVVLIGGPSCCANRIFFDPASHRECAIYATKACPYLSNADWDYATQPPRHLEEGQTVIKTFEERSAHRPDRIGVYFCRSYEMVKHKGTWYVLAGKPTRIDWTLCAQRTPQQKIT